MAQPRAIAVTDCDAVAELIRRAFGSIPATVVPRPSALQVTGATIAAHLAAGGGGLVALGCACLLWAERRAGTGLAATEQPTLSPHPALCRREREGVLQLSRLAVAPEHRRQGLARALLEAAEAEARRRGLPTLALSTRLALHGNRALFAGYGFIETARHAHPGFDHPTSVDMEKRLAPDAATAPG